MVHLKIFHYCNPELSPTTALCPMDSRLSKIFRVFEKFGDFRLRVRILARTFTTAISAGKIAHVSLPSFDDANSVLQERGLFLLGKVVAWAVVNLITNSNYSPIKIQLVLVSSKLGKIKSNLPYFDSRKSMRLR